MFCWLYIEFSVNLVSWTLSIVRHLKPESSVSEPGLAHIVNVGGGGGHMLRSVRMMSFQSGQLK
jgi:hypothetical protein